MNPIDQIIERLTKYPHIEYSMETDLVTIPPADSNGFEVSFQVDGEQYQVSFEGWHAHFEYAEDALDCFSFGLTAACRLKVTSRGRFAHLWTVQFLDDGEWIDDSDTGLLIFPFWKTKHVEYKRNRWIEPIG